MKDDLLIQLHILSTRISSHGGVIGESMVERYKYFVEHSEHGKDCAYARKCRDLFEKFDYSDILEEFKKTLRLFELVEGRKLNEEK